MSKFLAAVLFASPLTGADAAQAPAAELKASRPPASVQAESGRPPRGKPVPKQAAYRGGKTGSDASRCDMARDIKSDKLTHSNGMPIDANDLQTAENDIRLFCR